jgi:DnaJ-class molecular chaperone
MMIAYENTVLCRGCSGDGFTGDNESDFEVCEQCNGFGRMDKSKAPKTCDYCDEIVEEVKGSPFMEAAEMCRGCWDMTRETYVGSTGEDIGPFKQEEEK